MTGMNKEDSQDFIDRYFEKASVLKRYLDEVRREAVEKHYTRSAGGRIRWYEIPSRRDRNYRIVIGSIEREAGNMPIQGSCSDLLKRAMAYFYLAVRGGKWNGTKLHDAALILAVHDEIGVECDAKDAGHTCDCRKVIKADYLANGNRCLRGCLGSVPLLLQAAMERSYLELKTTVKSRDEEGRVVRKEIFLRDVPNSVDVVVSDYWSKG